MIVVHQVVVMVVHRFVVWWFGASLLLWWSGFRAALDRQVEVGVGVGGREERVPRRNLPQDVVERHGLLLGARPEVTCGHLKRSAAMRHPAVVALEPDQDGGSMPVHGPAGFVLDAVPAPVEDLVAQVVRGLDGVGGGAARAVQERGADASVVAGRDDGLLGDVEHAHAVHDVRVARRGGLKAQLRVLAEDVVGQAEPASEHPCRRRVAAVVRHGVDGPVEQHAEPLDARVVVEGDGEVVDDASRVELPEASGPLGWGVLGRRDARGVPDARVHEF